MRGSDVSVAVIADGDESSRFCGRLFGSSEYGENRRRVVASTGIGTLNKARGSGPIAHLSNKGRASLVREPSLQKHHRTAKNHHEDNSLSEALRLHLN